MEYYSVIRGLTLSHHGIKGMKWGVRRQLKNKYGYSQHQAQVAVQRARNKYAREYDKEAKAKNSQVQSARPNQHSTGKNYQAVIDKQKKELDSDSKAKSIAKEVNKQRFKVRDEYVKAYISRSMGDKEGEQAHIKALVKATHNGQRTIFQ